MQQVLLITLYRISEDQKGKDQPWNEKPTKRGAVNQFFYFKNWPYACEN